MSRRPASVQRPALHANWRAFLNNDESQRLSDLDARMGRRIQSLADDQREKTRIMNRAIRRMRRKQGKN